MYPVVPIERVDDRLHRMVDYAFNLNPQTHHTVDHELFITHLNTFHSRDLFGAYEIAPLP